MKLIQGLIEPDLNKNFSDQISDCLVKLDEWINNLDLSLNQIVSVNIFIKASSNEEYYSKREKIKGKIEIYYDGILPLVFLAQPPANFAELIIEIHALPKQGYSEFLHKTIGGISYILVLDEQKTKHVFASGIEDLSSKDDILECSEKVFMKMELILRNENMVFSDIIRQWNYIENITLERLTKLGLEQPYQLFNDVRSKFYSKSEFNYGYPSATGIGTYAGGTIISFYAVGHSGTVKIVPIDNPLQVPAFNYTEEVLVGEAVDKKTGKTSPKFVRAKYLKTAAGETIFVSGTASIRGEDSVAIGDLVNQTKITLENIGELFKPENLLKSSIQFSGKMPYVSFLRGYIKQTNDYQVVMQICKKYYPEIPVVLVQSDICRSNLLLEIEATVAY